jgi:hypothetical protein
MLLSTLQKVSIRIYIFRGERIRENYIKDCKLGIYMVVQKQTWMTCFMFKELFSFFMKSILGGISQFNHHLFILNGHGSHVNLEAIEKAS